MHTMRMAWMILAALLLASNGSMADEKSVDPAKSHLLIQVVKEKTGFRVENTTLVQSPLPLQRNPNRVTSWRFEVQGNKGEVLYATGLKNPTLLRGEFANPKDPAKIDAVHLERKEPVHFMIRVPLLDGDRIEFFALDPATPRSPKPPEHAWNQIGSVRFPKAGD